VAQGALSDADAEPSSDPSRPEDRPAVVNLLVHDGRTNADAFAATLFELAARDVLHVEEVGGSHAFRVRSDTPSVDLLPFEARVLDVCRSVGDGALVPFDELSVGVEDEVDAWWEAFGNEVSRVARAQGYLSRVFATLLMIGIGVLVVITAVALVYASTHDDNGVAQIVALGAFGALAFVAYVVEGFDSWDRLSRLGRARAREWRDVARELDESEGFREVRAGGSIVWGEVLAYAAALGVAPHAVHDIPVRPEGARSLWVRRGSAYEHVDVAYARWFPPGWGRPPWAVALVGVGALVAAVAVFAADVDTALSVIAVVIAVAGALTFALGFLDLLAKSVGHRGVVVARRVDVPRLGPWTDLAPRSRYVAIDQGTGRRIRALRIFRDRFETLQVGDDVTLLATPRLGYVRELTRR
jgi:hypothetical protein